MPKQPEPLGACVESYTRAVSAGDLPRAYRAILAALTSFRSVWEGAHPQDNVGSLYQGYLDMSFIAFSPPALSSMRLKFSLVYLHPEGRFRLWLAAGNRAIQAEVSAQLRGKPLDGYTLTELRPGVDAIIESEIPPPYDFDHPDELNRKLVSAAEAFQADMAALLTLR